MQNESILSRKLRKNNLHPSSYKTIFSPSCVFVDLSSGFLSFAHLSFLSSVASEMLEGPRSSGSTGSGEIFPYLALAQTILWFVRVEMGK